MSKQTLFRTLLSIGFLTAGGLFAYLSLDSLLTFSSQSSESFVTVHHRYSSIDFFHIFISNSVVLTLLLYGGFFTGGLLAATVLFWNGFIITLAVMQLSTQLPPSTLIYGFALHGSIEVPTLLLAATKSYNGISFYQHLLHHQLRTDLIPTWKEYGVLLALLAIAAFIESSL